MITKKPHASHENLTMPLIVILPLWPLVPCQLGSLLLNEPADTSPKPGDTRYGPERARPVPCRGMPGTR